MSRFDDLSPYTYDFRAERNPDPTVVNIGWLACDEEYPLGVVGGDDNDLTELFLIKLKEFVKHHTVNLYRGSHRCWCGKAQSNGEIRVKHQGITYVAPWMILHYVAEHQYKPPQVFIDAVLQGVPQPGTHD